MNYAHVSHVTDKRRHATKKHWIRSTIEKMWTHAHSRPCEIPEESCPPRCAQVIQWHIGRGSRPEASIVVRNVGKQARLFAFQATHMEGPGAPTAKLVVQPDEAQLAPGQRASVRVTLEDAAALVAGQEYRGEITIRGAWEQCVSIVCLVEPDPYVHCEIEQGDVPVRKWALRWYRHFQRVERCG